MGGKREERKMSEISLFNNRVKSPSDPEKGRNTIGPSKGAKERVLDSEREAGDGFHRQCAE